MDPIRLIEEPDLTDRERAALQAGKEQPVVYDVSGGAERLGKALSQPGASTAVTTSSVAAKLGIKLLITAALTALAFIAALQLTAHHEVQRGASSAPLQPIVAAPAAEPAAQAVAPQPEPRAPIVATTVEREPSPTRPARRPKAPPVAVQDAPAPALEPIETRQPTEQAAPAPAPREPAKAAPEEAPAPSAAMREMKGIARAKRALAEREPDKALAILADVARDFPRGYFVEERRALRVLALAEDGESEQARTEAASFVRDYPSGAFTARVKAAAER